MKHGVDASLMTRTR